MPNVGISSGVRLTGVLETVFKPGVFKFRLTRGDGLLIDDTEINYITVRNSAGGWVASTKTYDPATEYWTVEITGVTDPAGYWVFYKCLNFGIASQYPLRYRPGEQEQVVDLIQPGTYEDEIPYWEVSDYSYINALRVAPSPLTCADYTETQLDVTPPIVWYVMPPTGPNGYYSKRIVVKSSVPYKVTARAQNYPGAVINVTDHFLFALNWPVIGGCCNPGSSCFNSIGTDDGDVAAARITGGGLDIAVTRNNIFDETDFDLFEGEVAGRNHDVTFSNATQAFTSITCNPATPWCTIDGGVHTGTLRSISGSPPLMSIEAEWS